MFDELKKKIDIENELNEGQEPEAPVKEPKNEIPKINSTTIFSRDQILQVLAMKAK